MDSVLEVVAMIEGVIEGMSGITPDDVRAGIVCAGLETVRQVLRPLQELINTRPQHGDAHCREEWHRTMRSLILGPPGPRG